MAPLSPTEPKFNPIAVARIGALRFFGKTLRQRPPRRNVFEVQRKPVIPSPASAPDARSRFGPFPCFRKNVEGGFAMPDQVVNYDGSISFTPQQLVTPQTVVDIQAVLRDTATYPSPVRAMGTYHSLTPCASSLGTIVNMQQMTQIISIDPVNLTFTAQAGLQVIDAANALRAQGLQLMTNIEIGNMRLGAAACCHSKDALDGIQFGQFSSYVTSIKWVTPDGNLAAAATSDSPDLLRMVRSSYGLIGIIYEVTLQVKPIEALHFTYLPRPIDELQQAEVDDLLDTSQGLICWTVNRTCIFQQRQRVQDAGILGSLLADIRRRLWSYTGAHVAQFIEKFFTDPTIRNAVQQGDFDVEDALYHSLHILGGITLLAPDKIIDYHLTPPSAKYAFTFWAFPRAQWLTTMKAYLDFADQHFQATGFRCNMPLGSYHIRQDTNSLLSYTNDGEIFSIDPINAVTDLPAWQTFMQAFNDFSYQRGGIPLLNQSPFVQRQHCEQGFGQRWFQFSAWIRSMDPTGRMLNPFFADLLSPPVAPPAPPATSTPAS
jgi:FAD binding domain/D-arabinono-1,4-lactone oxidase